MRKNGFTLIELLVSVSIVGLLFTIGLAYYQDFNRRQIVIQTAKELKNNLRHAQSKALAGEKDVVCGGDPLTAAKLDGWYVAVSSGNYRIYGRCGGAEFGSKTIQLPATVSLEAFEGGNPITDFFFQPLSRGVSRDSVNLCVSGYNRYYRINLTKSGEIKDEGFVSSCS